MAEQIATWMHHPSDQELSRLRFPAHATRAHKAMRMFHVEEEADEAMEGSPEIRNNLSQA